MRPFRRHRAGFVLLTLAQLVSIYECSWFSSSDNLYDLLGLTKTADAKAIKKAWHLIALREHPDKVTGGPEEKEAAAQRFKRAAEAYEVLSDATLRQRYDTTGQVPDDKAKAEASSKSKGGAAGDDDFGFDSGGQPPPQQRGWGYGYRSYDQ